MLRIVVKIFIVYICHRHPVKVFTVDMSSRFYLKNTPAQEKEKSKGWVKNDSLLTVTDTRCEINGSSF